MNRKKLLKSLALIFVVLILLVFAFRDKILQIALAPTSTSIQRGITRELIEERSADENAGKVTDIGPDLEIVAENLEIPWEIAFLPDGKLLVTERPGRLLIIGDDRVAIQVEGVKHVGEGGLMGMALHPDFIRNSFLYLFLTSDSSGKLENRVERYKLQGATLTERTVILDRIKGAANHDGGRIEFGPDGYLYITTGDAQQPELAQDTNSLNGKILRVDDDGSIPPDNPFGNAVYSYGHRNVQGIAWDNNGNLWATEHGPSGLQSGNDELNLIRKGKNYGWPDIKGMQTKVGMETPIIESGSDDTWAPADAEFLPAQAGVNGSIFFAGLRGSALYEAKLDEMKVDELIVHFRKEYGRLRAVRLGPDGYLYITTSNTDGRGEELPGDDKIIRIHTRVFQ